MDEEERFKLTPKGCAIAAMLDVGLVEDLDDTRINPFWILFEHYMKNNHYIKEI